MVSTQGGRSLSSPHPSAMPRPPVQSEAMETASHDDVHDLARKPLRANKWREQELLANVDSTATRPSAATCETFATKGKCARWRANQTLVKGQYHQHRIKVPKRLKPAKPASQNKWARSIVFGAHAHPFEKHAARLTPVQLGMFAALQAQIARTQFIGNLASIMAGSSGVGASAAPPLQAFAANNADAAALLSLGVESSHTQAIEANAEQVEGLADSKEREMQPSIGLQLLAACSKKLTT